MATHQRSRGSLVMILFNIPDKNVEDVTIHDVISLFKEDTDNGWFPSCTVMEPQSVVISGSHKVFDDKNNDQWHQFGDEDVYRRP